MWDLQLSLRRLLLLQVGPGRRILLSQRRSLPVAYRAPGDCRHASRDHRARASTCGRSSMARVMGCPPWPPSPVGAPTIGANLGLFFAERAGQPRSFAAAGPPHGHKCQCYERRRLKPASLGGDVASIRARFSCTRGLLFCLQRFRKAKLASASASHSTGIYARAEVGTARRQPPHEVKIRQNSGVPRQSRGLTL